MRKNWNRVAAQAALFVAQNPGCNKNRLTAHVRAVSGGISIDNVSMVLAMLGAALHRVERAPNISHYLDGTAVPEEISKELTDEISFEKVLRARPPEAV